MNSVQSKDGTTIVFDRTATGPALAALVSKSRACWQKAMKDLADVLPNRQHLTVPGQTHTVKASVPASVSAEFFAKSAGTSTIALAHQTS